MDPHRPAPGRARAAPGVAEVTARVTALLRMFEFMHCPVCSETIEIRDGMAAMNDHIARHYPEPERVPGEVTYPK